MEPWSTERKVWVFAGAAAVLNMCLLSTGCGVPSAQTDPSSPGDASSHRQSAGDVDRAAPARTGPVPARVARSHEADCPIQLQEVTETGITFVHTDGSSGRRYIVETVSTGLATFDYDSDGLIDVYFPNGAPLPGTRVAEAPRHALYKNLGGWRFQDVTEAAGVACTGYGLGATVGDYDNDGHPDLYLSHFGPKVLYRNNGDGTFTDVTAEAGVADGSKVGAGVAFLDIEGDGDLDLYAANYVQFSFENHVSRTVRGVPAHAGPRDYVPWPDSLYRNNGDGTFTDVSEESGISTVAGPGMGMVCLDYDADGDTDVYIGNDALEGNFLFQNDGTGEFQEVALTAGVAVNMYGAELGSMGAEAGDYDNDGRLDIFVTDFQPDLPVLYRNLGQGSFDDVTARTGAGADSWQYVTWGSGLIDFDNDGLRDLFIACGHLNDNVELFDDSTAYKNHNILLRNVGGNFVNVSDGCGLNTLPKHSARGAAFDDLDNDGDVDAVILNSRESPTVLRNMYREQDGKNHWLQVRLRGVNTNKDAVGAWVKVVAGDLVLYDEVHSGRSYQSHFGSRLHFGLRHRDRVDRIEVRWIGGGTDVFENVGVDQLVTLAESRKAPVAIRPGSLRP